MPSWWMWIVGAGLAGLFVVLLAAFRHSRRLTNPPGYKHPRPSGFRYPVDPLTAQGLAFENVALSTPSGETIRGWLVPGSPTLRDAILAVHGRAGDRTAFLPLLGDLHEAGAAVLLIDLRENGTSDGAGRGMALGMREAEDVAIAARELRARRYTNIIALGCSLGASAAIIAAAREPAISGVIADSALSSISAFVADESRRRIRKIGIELAGAADAWAALVTAISTIRLGFSTLTDPAEIIAGISPRPVLLIYGDQDESVPVSHAEALHARAGRPASLWIVQGVGHCGALSADRRAYASRVLAFTRDAAHVTS
jgi:pimeloyl-ACP methyl ester carboxylesterase